MNKDLTFSLTACIKADYERHPTDEAYRTLSTSFGLELSPTVDAEAFYESVEDKLINKNGAAAFTEVAIKGLIANIHTSHQKGWRDSATHLQYIINELIQGFAEVHKDARVIKETAPGNINSKNSHVDTNMG